MGGIPTTVNGDRTALYNNNNNTRTLASSFKSRRSELSMHDFRTIGDHTLDSPLGEMATSPTGAYEDDDLLKKL